MNQHDEQPHWCEAIYDAKAAELILYGRALGLGHGAAEDVLPETFLGLMQMPFAPGKPEHYVVRSFRNCALNYRRSLWRRLAREVLADGYFLGKQLWFEKSADESLEEIAAMRCLAGLPVDQRAVIVLKVWHGCTFEEIGGLLDISPNTAAGRYRYGLQPLQDAFGVLFFVAVGMLFDPMILVREPLQVLTVVAIIIGGKSLAAFGIVLALRRPVSTALTVSAALAQIGEFSFILAALGVSLGLISLEAQNLILVGALLSITLNPLVFYIVSRLRSTPG